MKRDPELWAATCVRELAKRGDIARIGPVTGEPGVGSPVSGLRNVRLPIWTYVSVRRATLYLESSLQEGTKWVAFEPNTPALWSQIRLDVGGFMHSMFLKGTFQGSTPQQAYFVQCDSENNTQASTATGIVNIVVGFAPVYPAEFVTIQISQMTAANPKPPASS